MKRRKMMLMVEMKRMMKMRDYCVFFDAFLPEVPCHKAPASSKQSPEP